MMFGGVDHRYYEGELNWVPLIEAGSGLYTHNEQLTIGTSLFVTRSWKRPLVPVLPSLGKHSFN